MSNNPVGNQIRSLQAQLENERKDKAMLLLAFETKAPEVFAEYMRLREEAQERADAAVRAQQQQQNRTTPQRFVPPSTARGGGRF